MLEKWKTMRRQRRGFRALLRDHELLTAKLNAYSFNLPVLREIHDYLSNRQLKLRSNIAMV